MCTAQLPASRLMPSQLSDYSAPQVAPTESSNSHMPCNTQPGSTANAVNGICVAGSACLYVHRTWTSPIPSDLSKPNTSSNPLVMQSRRLPRCTSHRKGHTRQSDPAHPIKSPNFQVDSPGIPRGGSRAPHPARRGRLALPRHRLEPEADDVLRLSLGSVRHRAQHAARGGITDASHSGGARCASKRRACGFWCLL